MMNYEEFKQQITDQIKDHLPEHLQDCDVRIQSVNKNNQALDGLIIQSPESNITPTIYLNSMYESFQDGQSMESILEEIADIRTNAALDIEKEFDVSMIMDYGMAKDHIFYTLIGSENNTELLADRPHHMVEDLAATYHVLLGSHDDSSMSVPITNQLMENYGVSIEELHETALVNTENLFPHKFSSLRDTMMELVIPEIMNSYGISREDAQLMADAMIPQDHVSMYVLTNSERVNGAASLLNDHALEEISDHLGGDFFVLPSSVHEVLIIPKTPEINYHDLEAMVQEINRTEVQPRDRLSDHVYEYDSQNKELFRSDRAEERQAMKEASRQEKKSASMESADQKEKKASVLGKLNAAKEQTAKAPLNAAPSKNKEIAL